MYNKKEMARYNPNENKLNNLEHKNE